MLHSLQDLQEQLPGLTMHRIDTMVDVMGTVPIALPIMDTDTDAGTTVTTTHMDVNLAATKVVEDCKWSDEKYLNM